jgi:succinate dehydrogenase / fumarate reductase membrane anchor subunit
MNGLGRERPAGGFELYAWFFMRISGIVLLGLALGHLVIMHITNSVDHIDYQFVAARYRTPFWRTYDLVMLWLALLHGLNGLRTVIDDYVQTKSWRLISLSCLWVVGLVFLVLGSLVILTFQPRV